MNKAINLLFLISSIGCLQFGQKENSNYQLENNLVACDSSINYGDISICLPEMPNYKECYANKYVKQRANHEAKILNNDIIGVYLTDSLFLKFQKEPNTLWTEFVKIYGTPEMKNKYFSSAYFNEIESLLRSNSEFVPWDEAIKSVNENSENLKIRKPALIEIYQPNEKIKSIIYLGDYKYMNESGKILWTANMCVIKNRLIYFAYYLKFEGSKTKEILKLRSNAFGKAFIQLND
jgi:hypothetical protein